MSVGSLAILGLGVAALCLAVWDLRRWRAR